MRVFLSHSTKDGDFVKNLAIALDGAGFTPWLCEVDIEKGANFVAEISKGLKQADLTLLVWSPDAANSPWTQEEWTAALKQQVEQSRIRFGIIMLRDHPLPPLLDTKNYIDARVSHDAGIRDTLEWLEYRHKAQRFSGLRAPIYLPDYRPQDFVGRGPYLERLRNALIWEPSVFLLYGEPGTGKSTLALRFAWDAQKDFDAVIFQTCGQRPLDAITADLVDRLRPDVKNLPPEEQRAAAKAWLRERQSLLVLDDVWSAETKQLAPGPNCSVLYTSRQRTLPGIAAKQSAEVQKFTEAEAEELFRAYLDPVFGESEVKQNRESLLNCAQRVEWLPIAVAVSASLLRGKSASPLEQALLKLRIESLADGAKNVNALFHTAIESQPPREQKLLAAGAVCVQEGFWLPLAAEIAELSEHEAEDGADRLVHSSLLRVVDRDRRRLQMHALLREQVRSKQGDDGLGKLEERHVASLERLFKDWEKRWHECRECLEEVVPAAQFLWRHGEVNRLWNLNYWGYSLGHRNGELDAALRIMKQEQLFWAGRDDPESKNTLQRSYGCQALILRRWGRLDEALALQKQKEVICLELDNKEGLQASYGDQAVILKDWGRLEEALVLHKEQERICLELRDKNSLSTSYLNQALILYALGQLKEAMGLLKKEEAIDLELGNEDQLQYNYGNQAAILRQWGRLEEAMALHKKKEAICQKIGNYYELAASYVDQARLFIMFDQLTEARNRLQDGELLCVKLGLKKVLGYCNYHWGLLARAQGDHKTEKEKLEQALAIFTELKMPRERSEVQATLDKMCRPD